MDQESKNKKRLVPAKPSPARVRFNEQKLEEFEKERQEAAKQAELQEKIEQQKIYLQEAFFDFYDHQKEILSYKLENSHDQIYEKYKARTIYVFLEDALKKLEGQGFAKEQIADLFLEKAENGQNLLESFNDNLKGILAMESSLEAELKKNPAYKANEKFVDESGATKQRRHFKEMYPSLKKIIHDQIARDVAEIEKVAKKYLSEDQMWDVDRWKKSIGQITAPTPPQPVVMPSSNYKPQQTTHHNTRL